jgi:small GTP-binding protein
MIGRKFDFSLKIVVVGDSGVGKTCLLLRYVRDIYDPDTQSTLGVEFMTKIIETEKHRIQLQLWDTAGQELFRSVTRGYYRGSAGAFLVFDLTNHDSFEHVGRWLHDVKEVARTDVVTVLLGNKADLADQRDVTREEAEAFAQANKMKYFETSAKTGGGIAEAIGACVEVIEKYVADGVYELTPNPDEGQFLPDDGPEPSTSGCRC